MAKRIDFFYEFLYLGDDNNTDNVDFHDEKTCF